MSYIIVACEALRVEIESLANGISPMAEIIYLSCDLHDTPEVLKLKLQETVNEIEQRDDIKEIVFGYGLCGRATNGLCASRLPMIFPRVHDCVPLYLGINQADANEATHNGCVLWLSAGMLKYGKFARHLVYERKARYEEKFGAKKAARMIEAENSIFSNYKCVCHISWQGLDDSYNDLAQKTAEEINLPFDSRKGDPKFLLDMLKGGTNKDFFIRINPGQTLDMDVDGNICGMECLRH